MSPVPRAAGARRRPLALLAAVLLAAACRGDYVSPLPEIPGLGDPGVTEIRIHLTLTYHLGEEPVQVRRPVTVELDDDDTPPGPARLLSIALEELVKGPSEEEREAGIHSFFTEETESLVREVRLDADTAVVDFGNLYESVPGASSSAGSFAFLAELNGTVFAIPGVGFVEYRMHGSCEDFWNFLQRSCQVVPRHEEA